MIRYSVLTIFVLLSFNGLAQSEFGEIRGKITDRATQKPIEDARIIVLKGTDTVQTIKADGDGYYVIPLLKPSKYDILTSYNGYRTTLMRQIKVNSDEITFQDIRINMLTSDQINAVDTLQYKEPLRRGCR